MPFLLPDKDQFKKIYWQRCFAFLLLLFECTALIGQNAKQIPLKRCPVKTINFEQGLVNNTITSVITDAKGLTWISTLVGMQRFNGTTLENITPIVDGDTIHINYAVFFLEGKNNTLLIGYKKGILEYNAITNSFSKKIIADPLANLHYSIYPIKETAEGIWCIQEHKGIIIYNGKTRSSNLFSSTAIANIDSLLNSNDILYRDVVACNDDYIFIISIGNKVLQINLRTHQFTYPINGGNYLFAIACNKNKLFLATRQSLSLYDINDTSVSKIFYYTNISKDNVVFTNIYIAGDDRVLVGAGKHLYEFDTICNFLREFTTLNRATFLVTGHILKPYEDKFKRIWLITNDDMKRIEDAEIPFGYFLYPNEKNNFVRALYYDEQKNILLAGCYNGGLQLYDTSGNQLWEQSLITEDVKDILSIEKLETDSYLIITLGKGWYKLNLPNKKLIKINLDFTKENQPKILSNNFTNGTQRLNDSTILISTNFNVFKCIVQNGDIKSVTPFLPGNNTFYYPLNYFLYASDKMLWLGSKRGLFYRISENGEIKTISIPDNYVVRSLMEDAYHNIWAGTEKGLFIFRPNGELIRQVTTENGLRNDFMYALLAVDSNAAFASTNLGLAYISKDGEVKNYTKELGLQENEFNTQSAARSQSGRFFFGGVNGITAFYPKALSKTNDTAIIHITRLVVNDSLFNSSAGTWEGDTISLHYYQNRLQFGVTAIGLLNPEEYVYHYRLKNFEDVWQTAHGPTTLRYTLEPGKYLLQINCSPLLSPNSIFSKEIFITINAPWWQTWWFRIIAFAVLVFFTALIVQRYNKQKYQQKIQALQLQTEIQNERERISKELHDNIGTQLSYISSNVDWMLDAPVSLSREEEMKRLCAVNKTAKEMISDLRETIWAMKKESVQLDELADKLKLFIQSQRILKPDMQINIKEEIEHTISFSPTEALNIFRICQEAIVNCIKHACASQLNITVQSGAKANFLIAIEDNGKGFLQNTAYKDHYGLENMRIRAHELGAKFSILSEEGKGTKIILTKA